MDKMLTVNQKRATKQPKKHSKKKVKPQQPQPLKVVYITNPIKFNATASEFRSLVQELTGMDAELPESARLPMDESVGGGCVEAAKPVAADGSPHHTLGQYSSATNSTSSTYGENGSDPSTGFGSSYDDDVFYAPHDSFSELVGSWHGGDDHHLDVLKGLI